MKWRDLLLTLALLLVVAPYLTAQTMPAGGMGSVSGGVGRFADGTAAAPGMAFAADTDTGWYRPGANILAAAANGTTLLWLPSTANLATLGTTGQFAWSNAGDAAQSADTGLARLGAASVSVTNSTTGKASLHTEGTALTLAIPAGGLGLATVSTTSVGNTGQGARLVVVCGPVAGTSSLLYYSGTTNVPAVLANGVGGGLIGC